MAEVIKERSASREASTHKPTENISQKPRSVNEKPAGDYDITLLKKIPVPAIRYGFLVEGGINIIVSEPGHGKSYLATSIGFDMARQFPESLHVVYIDGDNPVALPNARGVPDIAEDAGIKNFWYLNDTYVDDAVSERVYGVRAWLWHRLEEVTDEKTYKRIKYTTNKLIRILYAASHIIGDKKKLIIIDSLQSFADYNDLRQLSVIFEVMKKMSLDTTFLVIHHLNQSGKEKGLTYIKDSCDSMYYLENDERNESNEILEQMLVCNPSKNKGKMRWLGETKITFKYSDMFEFEVVKGVAIPQEHKIVLRTAIKILKEYGKVNQEDLVQKIKEKLNIGIKKIRRILNRYIGDVFNTETGTRNAKIFALNPKSETVKFLSKVEISEIKQSLYDTCKALQATGVEQIDDIRIERGGSIAIFKTISAILGSLYQMNDTIAEELLEILSERYQDEGL